MAQLTPKQREANQLLAGPARNIMLRGGSRSGKTYLLVRAICQRCINAPGSRHAIWRFRFNHVRASIWKDTLPTVMRNCFPTVRYTKNETDLIAMFPNGSQIVLGGLDDKERVERVLGQEFSTLYFNESSQIPWGSIETAMSRLAQKVALDPAIAKQTGRTHLPLKAYFDCNPPSKLHWSYQLFRAKLKPGAKEGLANPEDYAEMKVNPADNAENLPDEYFEVLANMSAAKRLRFEAGEWASEVNGALWSIEDRHVEATVEPDGTEVPGYDITGIDSTRATLEWVGDTPYAVYNGARIAMQRIVVAGDPSGTKGDGGGDDVGIVVAGLGTDGRGYVFEDASVNLSPEGWGRRIIERFTRWGADRVVGEANYGGDMVRATIQASGGVPYKPVNATRGKVVRAEPISALYEQGKISHVGVFPDLEDQMCNFTASGYVGEGSPDRADALVWALTELMLGKGKRPGLGDVL